MISYGEQRQGFWVSPIHIAGDGAFIDNVSISGFRGPGMTVSGKNATVLGSSIQNNNVGIEWRPGATGRIAHSNVSRNRVADIAYDERVVLDIANSYADISFEMTKGEFTSLDNELNYISQELITTVDPNRTTRLVTRLANIGPQPGGPNEVDRGQTEVDSSNGIG